MQYENISEFAVFSLALLSVFVCLGTYTYVPD